MKYGCFVDDAEGESCVFDNGEPINNCGVAMRLRADGKGKSDCEYWREFDDTAGKVSCPHCGHSFYVRLTHPTIQPRFRGGISVGDKW